MSKARTKGHNWERMVRRFWIDMGYEQTRTTREASKQLDGCGIDLVGTPFLIQCKAGYARNRPKFEEEYEYIKSRIVDQFGSTHPLNRFPIVLYHLMDTGRGNARQAQHSYVSMTVEDFHRLLETPKNERQTLDVL